MLKNRKQLFVICHDLMVKNDESWIVDIWNLAGGIPYGHFK